MINVLHLYYDLLNLYGENANVRCIVNNLKNNDIKVNVDLKSINDNIDIKKYDIIYIGSGSEEDIELALNDILKYKDDLNKYIESNKYLFLTGNSLILFGKYIKTSNDKLDGLDIFDYHTKYLDNIKLDNASKNRIVRETTSTCELIDNKIIGFQNRCDLVYGIKTPLFKTDTKYSNDLESNKEGFIYKNVYASHTIGPLFIRNPYFIDYLLNKVCESKDLKYDKRNDIAYKAYEKYLEN